MRCWKRQMWRGMVLWIAVPIVHAQSNQIGREVAIPEHLQNGQEFQISLTTLVEFGRQLFTANWTIQEGQGCELERNTRNRTALQAALRQFVPCGA